MKGDITVTSNEIVLGVQSEETDSNFISHDVEAHFMGIATITWINSKQGEKSFTFTFWTATSTSELNPDFDNPVIKLTFLNTMPSSFEHIWNDHLELGTKLTVLITYSYFLKLPALNIKTEPEIFHLDSIPDLKTHRVDQNSLAKSTSITQPYPISLSASIPAGFCVLEKNFKILIEVRNGSPFPIEAIEFVIIQHFQFLGQANSDCEEIEFEKIVKSTVFMGVDPHEEKLDDLTDLISSVLPTTLISVETTPDKHIGTHLKIWYTARLTTKMPSFSEISDLVVTLPLTIYNHEPTLTFLESIAPPLPPRLETDAEISSLFVPSRITSSSKSQSMPSLNLFSPSVVTPRQRNRTNKSLSTPIKVSPRTVSKRLPRNSVPLTLHHWVSSIVKSDGVQLFHFDCTDIAKNDSEMGSLCLYLITDSDSGIRISRNRLPTWWNFDLREECATEVDASVDYILGDSSENLNEKNSATEQEYFCRLVLGDGRYYIKVFGGNFERKVNPLHIQFDRRERNIRPITSFRISVTRIIPVAKEIAERVQSGMVWRKSDGIDLDIFDDAWTVGFDINGESLFAARANVGKSLQIGKVGSHMKSAMVTFGGREIPTNDFEVLCEIIEDFEDQKTVPSKLTDAASPMLKGTKWVKVLGPGGGVPPNAIPFGYESDGQKLYLARCVIGDHPGGNFTRMKKGSLCPGKVGPHLKNGISVPWGRKESNSIFPFEVLVYDCPVTRNQDRDLNTFLNNVASVPLENSEFDSTEINSDWDQENLPLNWDDEENPQLIWEEF